MPDKFRTSFWMTSEDRERLTLYIPQGLKSEFIRASITAMLNLVENSEERKDMVISKIIRDRLEIKCK